MRAASAAVLFRAHQDAAGGRLLYIAARSRGQLCCGAGNHCGILSKLLLAWHAFLSLATIFACAANMCLLGYCHPDAGAMASVTSMACLDRCAICRFHRANGGVHAGVQQPWNTLFFNFIIYYFCSLFVAGAGGRFPARAARLLVSAALPSLPACCGLRRLALHDCYWLRFLTAAPCILSARRLNFGNPWELERLNVGYPISFYGHVSGACSLQKSSTGP